MHTDRIVPRPLLDDIEQFVEAVANGVGYEDASFFGRLFRRNVGLTRAQYRKRFGSLRRALRTGIAWSDGHSNWKPTIAEFVEDAETLALLKPFGVDLVQGFQLGAPRDDHPVVERRLGELA